MTKTKIAIKIEKLEKLLGRKITSPEDDSILFHLYAGASPEEVKRLKNN